MIRYFRYNRRPLFALVVLFLFSSAPVWSQPADAASTAEPRASNEAASEGTNGIAPSVLFELPPISVRSPLPRIPERSFEGLRTPALPAPAPGDTIIVPQIDESIDDPELRARADSLNAALRRLAVQERLVMSQQTGEQPRTGLISRRDYLNARVALLEGMETDLKERLKRRLAHLDFEIDKLDSTISDHLPREIASLETFIRDNPHSREIADAKFIVGQLYYERERERNIRATLRFGSELRRWQLGLIPVMPRPPRMDESVAVPFYRDVVTLGTNAQLVPYSLYSLGKYHLERSRDLSAEATTQRLMGNRDIGIDYERQSRAQSDTAKYYYARLINEFPDDSVNVPEAYYVLASHYIAVVGGFAGRDTAAVYAEALIRDHWYSPRFQNALLLLAEVNFYNGVATVREPDKRRGYYSNALAYLAWLSHEIDAFEANQIPGVSLDAPALMNTARKDRAVTFMADIINRRSPMPGLEAPPPIASAMEVVNSTQQAPFGAELLRRIGDQLNDRYNETQSNSDLIYALTAYDSLLAIYPTYEQGPDIQLQIIENATYLSDDPQERVNIFLRQKLLFFERFNRNSDWAAKARVPQSRISAVDDTAATFLEEASKYLYATARDRGDRAQLREALDYFVTYFQTYPERPEAYELNWSVATELRDLGDYDRAYNEFMRVSRSELMDAHRENAALEAISVAQQLIAQEEARQSPNTPVEGQR